MDSPPVITVPLDSQGGAVRSKISTHPPSLPLPLRPAVLAGHCSVVGGCWAAVDCEVGKGDSEGWLALPGVV